jgi:hypothetical protein
MPALEGKLKFHTAPKHAVNTGTKKMKTFGLFLRRAWSIEVNVTVSAGLL